MFKYYCIGEISLPSNWVTASSMCNLISCFRDPNIKQLLLVLNLVILKWPFKIQKKVANLHKEGPNGRYTLTRINTHTHVFN